MGPGPQSTPHSRVQSGRGGGRLCPPRSLRTLGPARGWEPAWAYTWVPRRPETSPGRPLCLEPRPSPGMQGGARASAARALDLRCEALKPARLSELQLPVAGRETPGSDAQHLPGKVPSQLPPSPGPDAGRLAVGTGRGCSPLPTAAAGESVGRRSHSGGPLPSCPLGLSLLLLPSSKALRAFELAKPCTRGQARRHSQLQSSTFGGRDQAFVPQQPQALPLFPSQKPSKAPILRKPLLHSPLESEQTKAAWK